MISFIVPAHDEARLIGATLLSIEGAARASRLEHEVVVVDDASTDATAAIARQAGARVVRVDHRHIAASRNAGARAARGGILLFVDADTRVNAAVVLAALDAIRHGAIGGGATVRMPGMPHWHQRLFVACVVRLLRLAGIAPGCFLFCTRAAFDAAGGFDEGYYAGEDVAISRALARQGRFVILRETVLTSDRKLRTFSILDHLRLLLAFVLRGRGMLRSRDHLALWYARRRHPSR